MNELELRKNIIRLIEHDQKEQMNEMKTGGKFNARLSYEYRDLMERLSILEGCSKTELFKRALDAYASGWASALYPSQ